MEFLHRKGWQTGRVSLPTGLREYAELENGRFAVDDPDDDVVETLVAAGHKPITDDPDDETRELLESEAEAAAEAERDEYDELERSDLYALAKERGYDGEWNESDVETLREWLRAADVDEPEDDEDDSGVVDLEAVAGGA